MDSYVGRQADFLRALAHPTRLLLLARLANGERCVCELTADAGLEQANVSQHLAILRSQGIVEARRDGSRTMYRIKRPEILTIISSVQEALAAQFQEGGLMYEALCGSGAATRTSERGPLRGRFPRGGNPAIRL